MNENKKLIVPNEDQSAVIQDSLSKLSLALNTFVNTLNKKKLSFDYGATLIGCLRNNVDQIAESLEIPSESDQLKDLSKRLSQDREDELTHLKAQLANGIATAGAIENIKSTFDSIEEWWRKDIGLGRWLKDAHVTKEGSFEFGLWVLPASIRESSFSDTPVSDKRNSIAHIEALIAQGWILEGLEQGRNECYLLDCDANRAKLAAVIKVKYPDALITGWDAQPIGCLDNGSFGISTCKVFIRRFEGETNEKS